MDRHGVATWDGAFAVESCTYTASHGISPGVANLRILPQSDFPSETSDLVISDGAASVTIPGCKIERMEILQDGDGFSWSLSILDRRWKWRDLGRISGTYNQPDPHGKLIPWTIRSPKELAILCLQAMGEKRYTIDLPPGLDREVGRKFAAKNPPWIGVIPVTGTNPPVNWESETPAVALQNLCELFGRHVIYQLATDSILIAIPGRGNPLPDGSIARETPSIKAPEIPSGVGVVGGPTKYQARFLLEAVGEEWDGSYRPIDQLSYAPRVGGAVQVTTITAHTTGSNTFFLYVNDGDIGEFSQGARFTTSDSIAHNAVLDLAAAINASQDPRVKGVVTASVAGDELTLTGLTLGVSFGVWASVGFPIVGEGFFCAKTTQKATPDAPSWRYSGGIGMFGVRETDRLTYVDAVRLAQKSVFRTYRLRDVGLKGKGPIVVPGYGPLKRRQQLLLLPTKVEQVTPQPIDPNLRNVVNQQIVLDFYNGYSRDKPAACYGSTSKLKGLGGAYAMWTPSLGKENSFDSEQIFYPFAIDAEQQIVTFTSPIYRTKGGEYFPATPILETGVLIRNAETNELESYQTARRLGNASGSTNFAFRKYIDVQLNMIGDYDEKNNVTGVRLLEADAVMRARYYLDGLAAQYPTEAADTREYNGIVAIDLDGAISQVTWEVGGDGASTTASANTEHSVYVPPYPARRRSEFLRPAQQAALQDDARINMSHPFNVWLYSGPP